MAYGDGYKRQPDRYEERACSQCGELRMVRKDQAKDKKCKTCAIRSRGKLHIKNPSPQHDPKKVGSWNSYWKARSRCEGKCAHPEYYEYVEFNFADFDEWWAELGERPEGMSVDRIDVYGNYEPGNVRWATQAEQNRNKRPRRWWRRPNDER